MLIETNQVSRDWTIMHEGRRFYVNFTECDGQSLALCNRGNWEVQEETEGGVEDLKVNSFQGDTPGEEKKVQENIMLMEKLVQFCIENWDTNVFWRRPDPDVSTAPDRSQLSIAQDRVQLERPPFQQVRLVPVGRPGLQPCGLRAVL